MGEGQRAKDKAEEGGGPQCTGDLAASAEELDLDSLVTSRTIAPKSQMPFIHCWRLPENWYYLV